MPRILSTIVLLFIAQLSFSQIAKDFMLGGGLDLIKSDNNSFLDKAQLGVEANYFITRKFTGTVGIEIWTADDFSFVLGARWFPIDEAFVRVRGLVGENDLSIGGGWTKPLNEFWRFEAMGDFYFRGEFAIRAGVAYVIRRGVRSKK